MPVAPDDTLMLPEPALVPVRDHQHATGDLMKRLFPPRLAVVLALWAIVPAARMAAQAQVESTGSSLSLGAVIRLASQRRDEIPAARAKARAAEARQVVVSGLPDPMLSPSLDHLPFMFDGADASLTIEQQIPLSGIRRHRRASALADVERLRAEANLTVLDVETQAANAFLMLQERRRTALLIDEQIAFAREVVTAANARYASATAPQSDVLRAEVEVARLDGFARGVTGEIRAAEAMLNTSLALDPGLPVPPLDPVKLDSSVPSWAAISSALASRPEVVAGRAEVARAEADMEVMRDMYRPMAIIRTGPSYTMAEGRGWMAMVGISLPIWRDKLRAGVAEAQAMKTMSEADLRAMSRMIEGEAAAAVAELQASRDRRLALTDDVLPRARMAVAPAVAGYASGQLPLVSVIEAIQALRAVQSDLVAAETRVGLAWTRLSRAIGSYEAMIP